MQVNASALDLLLIEVVPLAERVVSELELSSDQDLLYRIEGYGYKVGQGLSEIFTKERARFTEQLDVVKFICKELWMVLYKKQIDNLKTNHRGTYVLIDNSFKHAQRMSTASSEETLKKATPYLWFPVGVIRGSLAALGIEANVSFDSEQLPGISFNIQCI